MKNLMVFILALLLLLAGNAVNAQISNGGNFTLEQSVIAGGGGKSIGGNFSVEGTGGQAAAGKRPTGLSTNLQNGFWTAEPLAPTAATAQIRGRIITSNGIGIRNVLITLTELNGMTRSAISSSFGYYSFENITVGQTLIISVKAKSFNFAQPTQVVFINEEIDNLNFIAIE